MKKNIKNPIKIGMLFVAFLLLYGAASATTYTAVASGNWSSSATWGGTAPSFTLGAADQVNIGTGINVTMDGNVTVNGLLAEINVTGTLSAMPHVVLDVVLGTVSGTGTINTAQLILTSTGTFTFAGAVTADTVVNSISGLSSAAQMTVNDELTLSSVLGITTNGTLHLGSNGHITISGGSISLSGGTLDLNSHYNVDYVSASVTTGSELSGTGLQRVSINVSSNNSVTLGSDVTLGDTLRFVSGTLTLNGHSVVANGQIAGNVMIVGHSSSSLIVNTAGGVASYLRFSAGAQNLNNLTVNVGSGDSLKIGSNLTVHGTLTLSGGSRLSINGVHFTAAGDMSGTGSIVTSTGTSLAFTNSGAVSGDLNLIGSGLGRLTVGLSSNSNNLRLGSTLTVDTLDMTSGTLVLNSHDIAIMGDIAAAGSGAIYSTVASNITVNTAASTTGTLRLTSSWDTVNNLNVNIAGSGSLRLGSDVIVNGALNFTNGYVSTGSNSLRITSTGSISGGGIHTYVITDNGGYLVMAASVSNASTFHVGTTSTYLPAQIVLNSGSTTGTVGVNVSYSVYSHGTTGVNISSFEPMVNATWLFQNNIGAGINANMQLSWPSSAEVNGFVHTNDYISHYETAWDDIGDSMPATLSGSMYSVTRANITSMSPFAVFDQQTVPTGINQITVAPGEFIVYPNPAYNNLYVKTGSVLGEVNVEIYNTLGQMVSSFKFNNDEVAIPVNQLAQGTYLIKLYNDNMQVVKKFSKL